jgi:hypothetical protein
MVAPAPSAGVPLFVAYYRRALPRFEPSVSASRGRHRRADASSTLELHVSPAPRAAEDAPAGAGTRTSPAAGW